MTKRSDPPVLIIFNQMAGPMTWELAEDLSRHMGRIALLTGHPDTLAKMGSQPGLDVYRSVTYRRGSLPLRLWTWVRYWLHAFVWAWQWPRDVPLLLFSNPPLAPWLGWLFQRLRGTRYAVMVHDIYPDVVVAMGHRSERSWIVRLWRRLNRHAYNHAEVVMTLSDGMAQTLRSQFDPLQTAAGRIEVILPWCDTQRITPSEKRLNSFAVEQQLVDKLTVMYSGNMGLGHDLETMIRAAEQTRDEPDIHFVFIGAGPKWDMIQKSIQAQGLENATLLEWQPEEELPRTLSSADVAMVSLESELAGLAVPSKAFYFLAAGTPLLLLCDRATELGQLVEEFECGWQLKTGDVDSFVRVLRSFRDNPHILQRRQQASRIAAQTIADRATNSGRLEQILRERLNIPAVHPQESSVPCSP